MNEYAGHVSTEYLELVGEYLLSAKMRSYERLNVSPDQHVLDVGCGTGVDAVALAARVGSHGCVMAFDLDPNMVVAANERVKLSGKTRKISCICADARKMPFPEGQFDASRSDRIFQHLEAPLEALREMVRVTKRGGRVMILDPDWATQTIDSSFYSIERTLVRVHAERLTRNGYSGRQLFRIFNMASLANISVEITTCVFHRYDLARKVLLLQETEALAVREGFVSEREINDFREELEAKDRANLFFASLNLVTAVATKP